MLPAGHSTLLSLDGAIVDGAIGSLVEGHTEAGVEYRLEFVPPDLWPLLIIQFSGMVIPDTCSRSSAVFHWGSQFGLLTLDVDKGLLRLVVRGPDPLTLRVQFHWNLMAFVERKYPHLATTKSLHGVCHVCHNASALFGRPLTAARKGMDFECIHRDESGVVLPVEDLIEAPIARVDGALSAGVVDATSAARLCALAARMVDTAGALVMARVTGPSCGCPYLRCIVAGLEQRQALLPAAPMTRTMMVPPSAGCVSVRTPVGGMCSCSHESCPGLPWTPGSCAQ
jgi:hypothetical protein